MRIWSKLLIAAPVAAGLLAAPAANADWRDQRGWHGDQRGWHGGGHEGWHHHDNDNGNAAAAEAALNDLEEASAEIRLFGAYPAA